MTDRYRVKEAVVSHCDGYRCVKRRMFIAERHVSFLGLFRFWFPCGFDWRFTHDEALVDVEHSRFLRGPIPPPVDVAAQ